MKAGIAFEILVKRIPISVGFSEVQSDGTYIYDGSSGRMLQGLGEAHNADVLLEPPVQTPFLNKIRLLVECKDYKRKVGLDVVRDALGLREDVNHFELVDANELLSRKTQRRQRMPEHFWQMNHLCVILDCFALGGMDLRRHLEL